MSIIEQPLVAPAVETDEVSAALERAADLLVEKGWCQGVTFDPSGAMCARGAILAATSGTSLNDAAEDRLARFLDLDSIIPWNDSAYTTSAEVIRAMKEAAAA